MSGVAGDEVHAGGLGGVGVGKNGPVGAGELLELDGGASVGRRSPSGPGWCR